MQVLYTSAVLEKQFELRKEEYKRSLKQLRSFGLEPWIVESRNIKSSFFDKVSKQVLYPNVNRGWRQNKGVNEAASMRASVPFLPFADDDMVIKLTGRYILKSSKFIDLIKETMGQYEAYASYGQHFIPEDEIFTGCVALRWDLFKKFLKEMNFMRAEKKLIPIERLMAEFLKNQNLRVYRVKEIDISARVFFSGDNAKQMEF